MASPAPSSQMARIDPLESNRLLTDVLKSVSRSFYLSIRILPRGMREPVAVAYLLARAADTSPTLAPWLRRGGWKSCSLFVAWLNPVRRDRR